MELKERHEHCVRRGKSSAGCGGEAAVAPLRISAHHFGVFLFVPRGKNKQIQYQVARFAPAAFADPRTRPQTIVFCGDLHGVFYDLLCFVSGTGSPGGEERGARRWEEGEGEGGGRREEGGGRRPEGRGRREERRDMRDGEG